MAVTGKYCTKDYMEKCRECDQGYVLRSYITSIGPDVCVRDVSEASLTSRTEKQSSLPRPVRYAGIMLLILISLCLIISFSISCYRNRKRRRRPLTPKKSFKDKLRALKFPGNCFEFITKKTQNKNPDIANRRQEDSALKQPESEYSSPEPEDSTIKNLSEIAPPTKPRRQKPSSHSKKSNRSTK